MDNSEHVTTLLRRWKDDGDSAAEAELFGLVERSLVEIAKRSLARHSGFDHKVDPRELVNEAYIALRDFPVVTVNRRPFFALMARVMRNVLMDVAKRDRAAKRPATRLRVTDTDAVSGVAVGGGMDVLEYYEAIDALQALNRDQARAIEWRILGYTTEEISDALGRSTASIGRDLRHARAFIAQRLGLDADWLGLP